MKTNTNSFDLSALTEISKAIKTKGATAENLRMWAASIKNISLLAVINMPPASDDSSSVEEIQENVQFSYEAVQFLEELQVALESQEV